MMVTMVLITAAPTLAAVGQGGSHVHIIEQGQNEGEFVGGAGIGGSISPGFAGGGGCGFGPNGAGGGGHGGHGPTFGCIEE